jgi:thiosulfate/3-mercaptopyruvate sulfurtransferase
MSGRGDVLISVEDLAERLSSGDRVQLLDVRWRLGGPPGREEYRAGHIPGAVYVDLDEELAGPAAAGVGRHPLPEPARLQSAARSWGLRAGRPVVVYDDLGNLSAARAWWLLRWAGLGDVRLLDGGLAAWREAGHKVTSGDEPVEIGDVELVAGRLPSIDPDAVTALVADGGLLLDARAGERYRGEVASVDPQPGHIPGAVSAPTAENLTSAGTFRPTEELVARFAELGVGPGRPVGVYCGSGVTAAHELAALAIAGIEDVALYPGSWSQWATLPDRPIVTGPQPTASLITAREAKQRVADGAVLLDTRSPGGREKTGAIPGAVIVDRDQLEAEFGPDSPTRHPEVSSLDTPLVVICGSINGSGPVAEALIGRGFVNVVHVDGGARAWHELTP